MGDYGHVAAFGPTKTGREKKALEVWADALDYYEKAVANGKIESYDTIFFQATGDALPSGIIILWGSEDQVEAVDRDDDRRRVGLRAGLVCERYVETKCMRGAAALEGMGNFIEVINSL